MSELFGAKFSSSFLQHTITHSSFTKSHDHNTIAGNIIISYLKTIKLFNLDLGNELLYFGIMYSKYSKLELIKIINNMLIQLPNGVSLQSL
jgi:hypothetical protein